LARPDWILLLLSRIAKLGEFFVLWRYDASMLAWIAISSWFFLFAAALTLKLYGPRRRVPTTEIDIVTGGARKVFLRIPKALNINSSGESFGGLGNVVGIITVVATYLVLGRSINTEVFFVWTAFQVLCIVVRSTIFSLVSDREPQLSHVDLEGKLWHEFNTQDKARVHRLVLTLSKYQLHLHPLLLLSYTGDMELVDSLGDVPEKQTLSSNDEDTITISVHGAPQILLLASVA
jgi:hypothetical protein